MFNKEMPINANRLLIGIFETYLDGMIYLRILLELNHPNTYPFIKSELLVASIIL